MITSLVRSLVPTLPQTTAVVHLLGEPHVTVGGRRVEVPEGSKRLLGFVALSGGRVDRRRAAGSIWPEGDDPRAAGNLRSALWRLRRAGLDVLDSDKAMLFLREGIVVDVTLVCDWAAALVAGPGQPGEHRGIDWSGELTELLPGWYDDWVVFERERIRQRMLHALEALSRRLTAEGRYGEAVEAGIAAVAADPLRESAVRTLIEAYLAEGNVNEASRAYSRFSVLLHRDLGVLPSRQLQALVSGLGASAAAVGPLGTGRVAV
jgi:DNA-binding SARP family transcriptional activator